MRFSVTYKEYDQVEGRNITRVIHFEEADMLAWVFEKVTKDWQVKTGFDVELHCDNGR